MLRHERCSCCELTGTRRRKPTVASNASALESHKTGHGTRQRTRMRDVVEVRSLSMRRGTIAWLLAADFFLRWSDTKRALRALICPSSACSMGVSASASIGSPCARGVVEL